MSSLQRHLRDIERVPPPNLWPEIESIEARPLLPEPRGRQLITAGVALVVVLAGVLIPLGLLRLQGSGHGLSSGDDNVILIAVVSQSMAPTLSAGDAAEVDTDAYRNASTSRGDIIVFHDPKYPGIEFIKRVIGLPGDTVDIREGSVFVNGQRVDEPYVSPVLDRHSFPATLVDPGRLFVLGDNRTDSNDSRFTLGQIAEDQVIGQVVGVRFGAASAASSPPPPAAVNSPSVTNSSGA